MLKKKKVLVVFCLLAFAFAVVGCGGGGGTADPDDTKVLVFGSDTAYAPFEWQDTATGEFVGFDIDLMDAIFELLPYDYKIQSFTFEGLIPALTSGTIDGIISAMTIKPERAERVDFTDPYYKSGLIIAVHQDNEDINSFDDLAGKKLGVQIGTTGADKAKQVQEEYPDTTITTYDRIPEAFMALRIGAVDAVVNDAPVTLYAIEKDAKKDIKVVGEMLSSEYYGIAIAKSNPELYAEINGALNTLKENGTLAQIYQKWFGELPPEDLLTITVDEALAAWED